MNRVLNATNRTLALVLTALAVLPFASAQFSEPLDEAAFAVVKSEFLALEAGFEAVDVDDLELGLLVMLPDTGSVFSPTGALDALTKAVMVIEMQEGRLERSRYQLSVRLVNVEYADSPAPSQYLFVAADRFNIGPVVHAQLVEELGADVVAPVEEFGVGPNVSWNFVMQPVQGHQAMLVAASRNMLSDEEAAWSACLYGLCLSVGWDRGPQAWETVETPAFEELAPMFDLGVEEWELLNPEVMAAVVSAAAGLDPLASEVSGQDRVIAQLVIDKNVGQDWSVAAVLRQGDLMDDSLAAIWHMAVDVGFLEGRSVSVAYECRRGDDAFALPGSYCP